MIEDNKDFAESVKNILKKENIDIYHVENGNEAIKLLNSDASINVAIVDLKLPDYDGKKLVEEIKKTFSHVKVIILTGHHDLINVDEAVKLGIFNYLEKPVSSKNLKFTIKRALLKANLLTYEEKMLIIGNISTAIAHDIKNALRPVMTNAEFIKENIEIIDADTCDKLKAKSKQELDIIIKSVKHCMDIVNDLMDYAYAKELDKSNMDINDVLEESLKPFESGKNIKVKKDFARNLIYFANSDQLRRVFTNIINNSIDAMPNGGDIRVTSKLKNNHISIEISDTGIGISRDNLKKVFEPFFSLKKGKGMGLGLAIVKNIIESQYGGAVEIESERHKGTKVTINLSKD
ncbi:MAG: hybrid sensor histidine kinase/response regulator [Thermodesulfovibrionales bacterium]